MHKVGWSILGREKMHRVGWLTGAALSAALLVAFALGSAALAQEAGMGLDAYEDFAFSAMGLDEEDPVRYWQEKSEEQAKLKERLEEARELRLVGPGTDLTFSVEGRTFVNSAGSSCPLTARLP